MCPAPLLFHDMIHQQPRPVTLHAPSSPFLCASAVSAALPLLPIAVGVSGLNLRRELAMPHHEDTPEAVAAAQQNPCSRRRLAMPHEEGDR